MSGGEQTTKDSYERKYEGEDYYWSLRPSETCFEVLRRKPPIEPVRLLDIGCGEGRNAVFFARNGYSVDAFDITGGGVEKARRMASDAGVSLNLFEADLNEYRLSDTYDVLFSTGTLHFALPELRDEIFANYRERTASGGLNVFSVFVEKPFIPRAPDADPGACHFRSGELFTFYHDWRIELCREEIFHCESGGTPHEHAVNRLVARKPL